MANTPPPKEMHCFQARLATFEAPVPLSKRRASAHSKKKGANTVEWPHKEIDSTTLARAGFFYRPSHDAPDNVQCFLCIVKLDGWEPADDPVQEHLAHSANCAWAQAISVRREDDDERDPEERDPLAEDMLDARKATFTTGDGWPHESKKGWKCKVNKMAEAGWSWDPASEEEEDRDGVTCFYCNLSLDGWEPKDDPFVEHKRRSEDCRFFQLLKYHHGEDAANGTLKKKSKGRAKATGRSSTASKVSRASTQSAMSTGLDVSENFEDGVLEVTLAGADDSILSTATDTSRATATSTTKGRRKAAYKPASTRGPKGKKKAMPESEIEDDTEQFYADVSQSQGTQDILSSQAPLEERSVPTPPKGTRRGTRASKQLDSSVIEISQIESVHPTKVTRGRKAIAEVQAELEPVLQPETPNPAAEAEKRLNEVSAQLQDELEHSVDNFEPLDESTPVVQPVKSKRGVKRTSDGLRKRPDAESSAVELEVPSKAKGKRGRPKKTSATSFAGEIEIIPEMPSSTQYDPTVLDAPTVEIAPAPKKGRGRPKGKKASTASSSRSSRTIRTISEPEVVVDEKEKLVQDEMEIEAELERIASEQSVQAPIQTEQDQAEEFEGSPSQGRPSADSAELEQLRKEIAAESDKVSERDFPSPPRRSRIPGGFSPSPAGSDKENQPSSGLQPLAKQAQPPVVLSPTKAIRIPLAASTPNRSPAKVFVSPSKQVSHLTSSAPWTPVDLDTVLLASPQPSPGKVGQQLVAAAGALTSPEKMMSVEEWVRHRAVKGEEELKSRCEQMVAAFEKEGMRGLETLNGINVVC